MPFQPVRRLAVAVALLVTAALPAHALVFNLTFLSGTSQDAETAFQAAANTWSGLLTDPVTVNLTVGTSGSLGAGILASTISSMVSYSYSDVRTALSNDITSAADATVVANLPIGSVPLLINDTKDNPNGVGSPTAYLDNDGSANNTTIRMTSANAHALGLAATPGKVGDCGSGCDASITFSSGYTYDYDPSDGISAGSYDLTGLVTHEIGHALGFISGVDMLDTNSPNGATFYNANEFVDVSTLDLFRCSAATAGSTTRDFTASTGAKFFSIDGCNTADLNGSFSTGLNHGDGHQASHWKDDQSLGVMDPTAAAGEKLTVTPLDLQAFDAIGWNLATVPEPASLLLLGTALAGLLGVRRHGRFRRG